MSIKAGLRALSLGVTMVWGTANAEAVSIYEFRPTALASSPKFNFANPGGTDDYLDFQILVTTTRSAFAPKAPYDVSQFAFVHFGAYAVEDSSITKWNDIRDAGSFLACADIICEYERNIRIPLNNIMTVIPFLYFSTQPGVSATIAARLIFSDDIQVASLGRFATPIPGALPMLASVLGIGGWLGYRRKRAQCEAIAVAA